MHTRPGALVALQNCCSMDPFAQVLEACELMPDIRAMPAGDATRVTDGGDNLSGGQRARVSLARTLYAHSDVYLLDDCLAALDGKVACGVLRSLLYSPLMSHATVIMASSHQPSIAAADFVITMEAGRAAAVVGQAGRTAVAAAAEAIAGDRLTRSPSRRRPLMLQRSRRSRSTESSLPRFLLEDAWEQCVTTRAHWDAGTAACDVPPWPQHPDASPRQADCSANVRHDSEAVEPSAGATEVQVQDGDCTLGQHGVPTPAVPPPQARPACPLTFTICQSTACPVHAVQRLRWSHQPVPAVLLLRIELCGQPHRRLRALPDRQDRAAAAAPLARPQLAAAIFHRS